MNKRTELNIHVRRKITDALFSLMREKNFADITVTEIITRADVARASFYRNFKSKTNVLTDLIDYVLQSFCDGKEPEAMVCMSFEHVKKSFEYFKKYGLYLLDLYHSEFAKILLDELNKFHETVAGNMPVKSTERYSIYMYIGAMINSAIKWLESGATESADDIAKIFCATMGIDM